MSDTPRYKTLHDYLRVVRDHRLLVVVVTLVFAAAGYLLSARQEKTYQAEALLAFTDPAIDQGLLGGDEAPTRSTPEREAAIGADEVRRPDIAQRVREALGTEVPAGQLRAAITAAPEVQTNLVAVQATGTDPVFVTRLANEFARQAQRVISAEERQRIREAADAQRARFARLPTARRTQIVRAGFEERIGKLEALADFARPVEVVRRAEVPGEAIAPRPVRSGLLGAIIGLTLGLVAAFVRDALDRRLRNAQEVQAELRLPVLASVSEDAFTRTGGQANGRGPVPTENLEAFRILRRNLDFLARHGPLRSIAVTSAMAQEGKSTVAASLAWSHAYSGNRTLLVDCDLRRGSLAARLGAAPAPGLTDYLTGEAEIGDVLQTVAAEQVPVFNGGQLDRASAGEGIAFVGAGSPSHRPTELLESSAFADALALLSRSHDKVILDTSPLLPVADTLFLAAVVDALVVCVRASQTTRDQASGVRAALAKIPERPTGVVLTGAPQGSYGSYGSYAEAEPAGRAF